MEGTARPGLGARARKTSATSVGCSSEEKAEATTSLAYPSPPASTYTSAGSPREGPAPRQQSFGLVPPTPARPWCRPSGPSITLRSASGSIDSLLLHSPSWTAAERRGACTGLRSRHEGWKAATVWPGERARRKLAQRDGARPAGREPGSARTPPPRAPHIRSSRWPATHAQSQHSAFPSTRLPPCARATPPCG